MKLSEINIRDPFILPYNKKYYMYGSRAANQIGFDVYVSNDLEDWSQPKCVLEKNPDFWGTADFWAPEVHMYHNKFYMFATFRADGIHRGVSVLVSEKPDGIFVPYSNGPVTPSEWNCLDGTLYLENGNPYLIFCHEWTQIKDGEVCAIKLADDLRNCVGSPITLWKATDAAWVKSITENNDYVTDGPYIFKENGNLMCIWSSFSENGYVEAVSCSDNGKIDGKWKVCDKLLFEQDGGHGMIFRTFGGGIKFIFHSPNESGLERPVIKDIKIDYKYRMHEI